MDDFASYGAPRSTSDPFSVNRLIVGLLLLVPGAILYIYILLLPALNTLALSQSNYRLLSESEFVGMENFTRLAEDPRFSQAVGYTLGIVVIRILLVAVIPPVIGVLAGGQGFAGRATIRFLMSVLAVLISPAALIILFSAFVSPVWGTTTSPFADQRILSSPDGARNAVILLDAIITVGIAVVVGGSAFMAVMRGRDLSPSANRAGIGVWLLGLLLAAASGGLTFVIPFTLTGGGPANATTTTALELYNNTFRNFNIGYGAAQAVLMMIPAVFFGVLAGVVVWIFRLRLSFTPASRPVEAAGLVGYLSVPIMVLIGLPAFGLFAWGLWLTASAGGFAEMGETLNVGQALGSTLAGSWQAIWLIQLPLTYLIGLALGFVRPGNRAIANLIFVGFVTLGFIPHAALMPSWFLSLRDMGALNTFGGVGYGFLVNVFSLLVFKMFFDGAYERNRAAIAEGQTPTDAFLNTTLLPSLGVLLLVGAALTFLAAQAVLWPLLVVNDPDLRSFPIHLVTARATFATNFPLLTGMAVTFIGLLALVFLPIFALLQILVVDRLTLLAGPPTEGESARPKRRVVEDKPTVGF